MRALFAAVLLTAAMAAAQRQYATTEGLIQGLSQDKLTIETDDHRIVWYIVRPELLTASPRYAFGDRIQVNSVPDDQARYHAVWIQRLSHTAPQAAAAPAPPPPARVDPVINSAREASAKFVAELPSFQVHRRITRQEKPGRLARWQTLDQVTATLVYRNGEESYSDVHVGTGEVKTALEELEGLYTTGEFRQLVAGILDPEKRADFGRPRRVNVDGRDAWRYPFSISRERSKWRITAPSERYFPAYGGALWIDMETSRVLRVEMQARDLPKGFPFDAVEMNVDYSFVKLEAGETFLLPTQSEALNCMSRTNICLKNSTVFTNYVKFEADSKIIFEDAR
jgi:hypothetical protein